MLKRIAHPFIKSNSNSNKYFLYKKKIRNLHITVASLSETDNAIYSQVIKGGNLYDVILPAQGTIANALGLCREWVNKRLHYLVRLGLLKIQRRGYNETCLYFLPHLFLELVTRRELAQHIPMLWNGGINRLFSVLPKHFTLIYNYIKNGVSQESHSVIWSSPARSARGDPPTDHIFSERDVDLSKNLLKCTKVPLKKVEKAVSKTHKREGHGLMNKKRARKRAWSLISVASEVKKCLDEKFLQGFTRMMPLQAALIARKGIISNIVNGKVNDIVSSHSSIEDKAREYILWRCNDLGIKVTHPVYEKKD